MPQEPAWLTSAADQAAAGGLVDAANVRRWGVGSPDQRHA